MEERIKEVLEIILANRYNCKAKVNVRKEKGNGDLWNTRGHPLSTKGNDYIR